MKEYCIDSKGVMRCPTYDQCHHRGICLATPTMMPNEVVDPEEKLREEILACAAIELDPDEIVEITPTWKIKRSELDALKKVADEMAKQKREIEEEEEFMYQPSEPMSSQAIAIMNSILLGGLSSRERLRAKLKATVPENI